MLGSVIHRQERIEGNTVTRLVEKFAATKFDDLLVAKENADVKASALNYRKDLSLLSEFSATSQRVTTSRRGNFPSYPPVRTYARRRNRAVPAPDSRAAFPTGNYRNKPPPTRMPAPAHPPSRPLQRHPATHPDTSLRCR